MKLEEMLLAFGGVIAAVAGLGAVLILLAILRVALRLTSNAVSQTIRALWQLLFQMATDIRFLNMLAVIFCMLAERRQGTYWPGIALIVSLSAFVTATLHTAIFLLSGGILNWLKGHRVQLSASAERFIQQIRLNIGFLGLIYLSLGFCSLCYSWHMLSTQAPIPAQQFIIPGAPANYGTFFAYTAQAMADSIPAPVAQHFGWKFSDVTVPAGAGLLWSVILFFRFAFWGALLALLSALFFPRRIFSAA